MTVHPNMNIEIGKTYYRAHPGGPQSVSVIDTWEGDSFKVKYSEDTWGCRSMTRQEICSLYCYSDYETALDASNEKTSCQRKRS